MKLKLKNTPEQVELIKAIGSKNKSVSQEAQEAFAAFIGPIVQKVIQQASQIKNVFSGSNFFCHIILQSEAFWSIFSKCFEFPWRTQWEHNPME